MFTFFKKKKEEEGLPMGVIKADMHAHWLPGIDDGAQSIDDSLEIIKGLVGFGYEKLIATPHVMSDYYRNDPKTIKKKLAEVKKAVKQARIPVKLEAAAEYYLDEGFMRTLENGDELMTFGDGYILFETSFMNPSAYLDQAIFEMSSRGLKPILAHPERYVYLHGKYEKLAQIAEKGALLQVNLNSLTGYYSKACQKVATQLIDDGLVSFVGTDCHGERHLRVLQNALTTNKLKVAYENSLLNNALISKGK